MRYFEYAQKLQQMIFLGVFISFEINFIFGKEYLLASVITMFEFSGSVDLTVRYSDIV